MKFKIGDRVRAVKPYDGNEMIVGKTGTVVCLEEILIGVEFDGSIDGHGCRSNGKMDHCWWCSEEILEPNANCSDGERKDGEENG